MMNENLRELIQQLPVEQREHAEYYVNGRTPSYPGGETSLFIDATIYAELMVEFSKVGKEYPKESV